MFAGTTSEAVTALAHLQAWVTAGWIRRIDAAFASFLHAETGESSSCVLYGAAMVSYMLGHGHSCLDINELTGDWSPEAWATHDGKPLPEHVTPPREALRQWTVADWCRTLAASPALAGDASPLLLEGTRLYLRRYRDHERAVRDFIEARLSLADDADSATRLSSALSILFPVEGDDFDWQKAACALAAPRAFAIITGGPGTGKTTTVVRLLALRQVLHLAASHQHRPLRIRLAAPTGKAANRLGESIASRLDEVPWAALAGAVCIDVSARSLSQWRESIPVDVITLHRLLGSVPDSRRFRHHRDHRLPLDVLVIDEASMVDLEMMARVMEALPDHAQLILLGDKDQLASVEAGTLLAELCEQAVHARYTPATAERLSQVMGCAVPAACIDVNGRALDQAVVMLRKSRRFGTDTGIGALARAINDADTPAVKRVLAAPEFADATEVRCPARDHSPLKDCVISGSAEVFELVAAQHRYDSADAHALAVLSAQRGFQVLCALRGGPWGVNELNTRIEAWLRKQGRIHTADAWYPGRPVMVTRNDYALGLMNGDVGIVLARHDAEADHARLAVAFPANDGSHGIRWVVPGRLQDIETVYAMTIHKSQGSEFGHVALVLPDTPSQLLTRELVYTGVTRASARLTLFNPGGDTLLESAIRRQVMRAGGVLL